MERIENLNYQNLTPRIVRYMLYWAAIMNGYRCNADGEKPSLRERILAGSCLITLFAALDCDDSVDEQAFIEAASAALGYKWPGPDAEEAAAHDE